MSNEESNKPILNKLIQLYQSDIYEECKNRSGVRKTSADALDETYAEMVNNLNIPLTIEVGAHEGSFSRNIKSQNPKADCHAFEANPYVYNKYENMLSSLGIKYTNLAISNTNNEVVLHIPVKRNDSSIRKINPISSLYKRNDEDFKYKEVVVKSSSIESLYLNDNRRKSFWIDVEGAQFEVLSAIKAVWPSVSTVYIEIEKAKVWNTEFKQKDVNGILEERGFVEIMRDNIADQQYNAVYVRKELISSPVTMKATEKYYDLIKKSVDKHA